jgi:predicted Fe-Mo cluster-binding NifX family protein
MKLAMAKWNGRISPVFDVARQLLMLDIEEGRVTARRDEALPGTDVCAQANSLMALAPDVLICGALSQPMAELLAVSGIKVLPFTAGDVEEVITAWLAGALPSPALAMPGCCGRRRGCNGGTNRRRNGQRWNNRKEAI